MSGISAALIKALRDKTGAGIMDCKRALAETDGDVEMATERLHATGIAKAEKKATRRAAEGLVGVIVRDGEGAMAELNCETDFVARHETFQRAAAGFAALALETAGDLDRMLDAPATDGDGRVADQITRMIATIGEHIHLRRTAHLAVEHGIIAPYLHTVAAPGLCRIGVLVAIESTAASEVLRTIGRKLAMHVAASEPLWVTVGEIPQSVIASKRAELVEEANTTGKPAAVVEKIIDGRLRRFYDQVTLLRQPLVMNNDVTVGQMLEEAEREIGAPISVASFIRFKTGEGVEAADQEA